MNQFLHAQSQPCVFAAYPKPQNNARSLVNKHSTRGRHHLGLFPEKKIVSWRICIVKSSSSAWTQSPSRSTLPLSHPYPYFFPSPWHLTDLAVVETYLPPRPAQVEGRGKEALFLTLCTLLVHEISLLSPLIHLANPFSCLKSYGSGRCSLFQQKKKLVHLCENKANRTPKQKG